MLSDTEMYKIQQKAQWDDDKLDWKIPLFIFNSQSKDLSFPTINAQCTFNTFNYDYSSGGIGERVERYQLRWRWAINEFEPVQAEEANKRLW